jgi:hypothetical protein
MVNLVCMVNFVRTLIPFKFSQIEKELPAKIHEVHQVSKENRLATFNDFSGSSFANRSSGETEARLSGGRVVIATKRLDDSFV